MGTYRISHLHGIASTAIHTATGQGMTYGSVSYLKDNNFSNQLRYYRYYANSGTSTISASFYVTWATPAALKYFDIRWAAAGNHGDRGGTIHYARRDYIQARIDGVWETVAGVQNRNSTALTASTGTVDFPNCTGLMIRLSASVTGRTGDSNEPGGSWASAACAEVSAWIDPYVKTGLHIQEGSSQFECVEWYDPVVSPLKAQLTDRVANIYLVDTSSADASNFRIATSDGVKALCKGVLYA